MATRKKNASKTPSWQNDDTANWLWLRSWTKTVDKKLLVILNTLKDIQETSGQISPELEKAINKASKLSKQIDDLVPDQ